MKKILADFPPTFIVHGQEDINMDIDVNRSFYQALKAHGVKCRMREVPSEGHTFAAKMKTGSLTRVLWRGRMQVVNHIK